MATRGAGNGRATRLAARRTRWLVGALLVATACGGSGTAPPALILGEWGGDHAGLVATADSGTMEYDCAVGRITQALRPQADGTVLAVGTHTPGRGGPIRVDEVLPRRPARYSGRVSGDRLTLTVVMTDSNVTVGTFDLVRGRSARVFKCL
ncbi:MAG: hypothetical protein FJ363_01365 [Gemmatimonadetes bacterium]|nr:hypothetical protein [Gemmatimonadota bacterium]